MRRILTILGSAILFVAAPTGAASEPVTGEELFPLDVGLRWTYQIQGQDDRFVVAVAPAEKIGEVPCFRHDGRLGSRVIATEHVFRDKTGVYRYRSDSADIEPPLRICKFPPTKGDTWKIDYKVNDKAASIRYECDLEEIEVKAGKFNAIVIRAEVSGGPSKVKNTCWYAPKVGLIKQLIEDGDRKIVLELEKFDRVPPKKPLLP